MAMAAPIPAAFAYWAGDARRVLDDWQAAWVLAGFEPDPQTLPRPQMVEEALRWIHAHVRNLLRDEVRSEPDSWVVFHFAGVTLRVLRLLEAIQEHKPRFPGAEPLMLAWLSMPASEHCAQIFELWREDQKLDDDAILRMPLNRVWAALHGFSPLFPSRDHWRDWYKSEPLLDRDLGRKPNAPNTRRNRKRPRN